MLFNGLPFISRSASRVRAWATHLHRSTDVVHVEVELGGARTGRDFFRQTHGASDGENAAGDFEGLKLVRGKTQSGGSKSPVEDLLVECRSCGALVLGCVVG